MKVTFSDFGYIRVNMEDEREEVMNYLFDQIYDRLDELLEHDHEIETNHEEKYIEVSIPILDLIYRIIEEKEYDIEWEKKHGERD